jgi:hypothetical protein
MKVLLRVCTIALFCAGLLQAQTVKTASHTAAAAVSTAVHPEKKHGKNPPVHVPETDTLLILSAELAGLGLLSLWLRKSPLRN